MMNKELQEKFLFQKINIGKAIKERRNEKGLSLIALVELSGVSRMTIIRIERGEGSDIDNMLKLAESLDTTVSMLFKGIEA